MNCTPKVRQKTFGVQFVYEKDIHRETQNSKPSILWGTFSCPVTVTVV